VTDRSIGAAKLCGYDEPVRLVRPPKILEELRPSGEGDWNRVRILPTRAMEAGVTEMEHQKAIL
jgi:hypothetical protein